MYPMDYEEFRWALGDEATVPLLRQFYEKLDPSGRAARLFSAIPSELSKNASRYQVSSVLSDSERKNLDEVLEKMRESMTVNFAFHSDDPNVGLAMHSNLDQYKLFVGDTGLFVTMAFWDKSFSENIIYNKLLNDKLATNLGYVYENIVAQMLITSGNKLFYYTFPDGNKHLYEVDFLLSRGFKLWPVEVKSEGYSTHKSLDEFCTKFSSRISNRYLVYTKDLRKDGATIMLPVYMVGLL